MKAGWEKGGSFSYYIKVIKSKIDNSYIRRNHILSDYPAGYPTMGKRYSIGHFFNSIVMRQFMINFDFNEETAVVSIIF